MLAEGGSFDFIWESGPEISVVRNLIVARFLSSDADALLMVDADQGIPPEALKRLIDLDKPVVGCLYPMRRYHWPQVDWNSAMDLNQLLYQAYRFVGFLEEDEEGLATIVNGYAKADHIGTGIMLVHRSAFEAMMKELPELEGRGFCPEGHPVEVNATGRWGFFNRLSTSEGPPISEDISFCKRWRGIGGEIWADVATSTAHIGLNSFVGNYLDYLRALHRT
jgi:hypothetical protein